MAQKVTIIHTCDLHPDQGATTTITIKPEGVTAREVDVCAQCMSIVNELLSAGRPAAKGGRVAQLPRPKRKAALPEIREWAAQNGYVVAARGRVPGHIQYAYDQAHNTHATAS
jgi:hypothetical protein